MAKVGIGAMNVMPNAQWETVKDIVFAALSQPSDSWPEFLDRKCGGDDSLRSEVELLLKSYESGFLETSVLATQIPTQPALAPGSSVNHYEVVRLLGRGGMSEVYLARDTSLDRRAAIKIIHAESGLGDEAASRLLREARAVARLEHPGICSVYEVGEADGLPFISMQYIEGSTLQDWIGGRTIDPETAFTFARQIAEALAEAHRHGIIHRDVKPANVMIDGGRNLKVLDFGLAKNIFPGLDGVGQTATGMIAGTVQYMSPEHLRGKPVDGQTDVWSLGVVLYQMLAGRLPFSGDSKADLIASILNDAIEPVRGLPPSRERAVNHVLGRALERDQDLRYKTMGEFCEDLRALESAGTVSVTPSKAAEGIGPAFIHKRRLAVTVLTLALISAIAAYLYWDRPSNYAHAFADAAAKPLRITGVYDTKKKMAGAMSDLSFSPDGRRLVFAVTEADKSSIQVLELANRHLTVLTEAQHQAHSPVWSPDGEWIAFVAKADGKDAAWSIPVSGGSPRHLVDFDVAHVYPKLRKWSNDGSKLFFDGDSGPSTVEINTGQVRHVDVSGMPGKVTRGFSISHDETTLLLPVFENNKQQLWLKSISDGEARLVSEAVLMNGTPEFFPDARTFAYSADDGDSFQIYVAGRDGAEPRPLTASGSSATSPVVSPDGATIAYVSNVDQANIYRTSLATGVHEMVTDRVNLQLFPALSPDGRSVAYQVINHPSKFTTAQLLVAASGTDESGANVEIPGGGYCVRFDPRGGRVAFVRGTPGNFHIWTYDIASGSQTQITRVPLTPPAFGVAPFELQRAPFESTPDGTRFAYLKRSNARDDIYIVGVDAPAGADNAVPIEDTARLGGMKWSNDGSQIAFTLSPRPDRPNNPSSNRVMVLRGTTVSKLAEFDKSVYVLGWSTADDAVLAAVEAEGEVRVVAVPAEPGSSSVRQVAALRNAKPLGVELSPDRKYVSYTVIRDGLSNICVTELGTGRENCLTSNADPAFYYSGVAWAPDSQSVIYSKQTGGMQIALISPRDQEKSINE
jgi:serine/threonine protein kinase/Tol biopolymer transport system component